LNVDVDIIVSRVTERAFIFSTGEESIIEVLVRAGNMKIPSKPICAEKGLQDINNRDGLITPFFLDKVLRHTSSQTCQSLQPQNVSGISTTQDQTLTPTSSVDIPSVEGAREWVRSLESLGVGSVRLKDLGTPIREVKSVEWNEMRNLVLFRFRCGRPVIGSDIAAMSAGLASPVGPSVGGRLESHANQSAGEGAGWVMEGAPCATKSVPADWEGGLTGCDTKVESRADDDD
jgi:hypothetical protein